MWKKFKVISVTKRKGSFSIKIGGSTPASEQKIEENSDREGISIIENNKKEEQLIQQSAKDWYELQVNRILNDE